MSMFCQSSQQCCKRYLCFSRESAYCSIMAFDPELVSAAHAVAHVL
jgi:hypothetical protein